MEEPDTNWITEFEKDEEIYKDFYKDPIESIKIFLLYVDNNNNLFHIKKNLCTLDNSQIKKESLMKIIANTGKVYSHSANRSEAKVMKN